MGAAIGERFRRAFPVAPRGEVLWQIVAKVWLVDRRRCWAQLWGSSIIKLAIPRPGHAVIEGWIVAGNSGQLQSFRRAGVVTVLIAFFSGDATLPIQLLGDIEIDVARASRRDAGLTA